MTEWQPIETAPKDKHILLYGKLKYHFDKIKWEEDAVFSGYWDVIDEEWTPSGATWEGPFMKCTHWMPLPSPPNQP